MSVVDVLPGVLAAVQREVGVAEQPPGSNADRPVPPGVGRKVPGIICYDAVGADIAPTALRRGERTRS